MDNDQVSVVAPQGEAQPTGEQSPDVTPDATTSESPEASTELTFETIAAKKGFKNPDDLAKAYANLESHSTKVSQRNSDLEKEFFSQPQKSQTSQSEDPSLQELDKFVNQRVQSEIQKIRAEWQDRESRKELRETIDKNPDFGKFAEDVKEVKKRYPDMPFSEALTFVKATKGVLAQEATSKALQGATQTIQKQSQAQVASTKPVSEMKVGGSELLDGATKRWKANNHGQLDDRSKKEIELIETEIFGQPLMKTSRGF